MTDASILELTSVTPLSRMVVPLVDPNLGSGQKNVSSTLGELITLVVENIPSTSITDAATDTTIASNSYIGISNGTVDGKIEVVNFLDTVGTSIQSLASAGTITATDTFPVLQSGTLVLQTESAVSDFVNGRAALYYTGTLEITADTALDGSIHNRKILICSQPITFSKGAVFVGNGFTCKILNLSSGNVSFTSDFLTNASAAQLAIKSEADVLAVTYSGGSVYVVNLGGGGVPSVGLSVSVSSYAVPVGQSISVLGTVNPAGTAVQIGYSSSSSTQPTSWTDATVSGYNFNGSIAGLSAGTYYVWARETSNTSVTSVSGAVTVAVYSVGITSVPTTGNTATPISASGSVGPTGVSVQIALSTSNSVTPSSGWVSAVTSGTTWSGSITPPATGTYYLWVQQIAQPTIEDVSGAITISAPSNSVTITSPPTTATTSQTLSLNGTVYPGSTAVQMQFGSSATVAPTGTWTAATPSGTSWSGNLAAPATVGTYYIWVEQTGNTSVTAVSGAVTVSAPAALSFSLISGSGNGSMVGTSAVKGSTASSTYVSTMTHGDTSIDPAITFSTDPATAATGVVFWFDSNATNVTPPGSGFGYSVNDISGQYVFYTNGTGYGLPTTVPAAPSTPGTYYAKYAVYTGANGTGMLKGVYASSAIIVS